MATVTTPPAPAPSPKSPPKYPDFCGRHRLQVEVQILNREIGFLEEELQSIGDLQPASKCCKEVNEFVGAHSDPLIPINRGKSEPCCISWRSFRKKLCAGLSWICCCGSSDGGSSCSACACPSKDCDSCCSCPLPKMKSCSGCCSFRPCPPLSCRSCGGCRPRCRRSRRSCCCCFSGSLPRCRCPEYSCSCSWSCPNCGDLLRCARFSKPCCVSRCFCP